MSLLCITLEVGERLDGPIKPDMLIYVMDGMDMSSFA